MKFFKRFADGIEGDGIRPNIGVSPNATYTTYPIFWKRVFCNFFRPNKEPTQDEIDYVKAEKMFFGLWYIDRQKYEDRTKL